MTLQSGRVFPLGLEKRSKRFQASLELVIVLHCTVEQGKPFLQPRHLNAHRSKETRHASRSMISQKMSAMFEENIEYPMLATVQMCVCINWQTFRIRHHKMRTPQNSSTQCDHASTCRRDHNSPGDSNATFVKESSLAVQSFSGVPSSPARCKACRCKQLACSTGDSIMA